jgi:glycosyltransferase involved in cell wall biosynthesis
MKQTIFYIISNIGKSLEFEWVADELDQEKYNLTFILLNPGDSTLEQYLLKKGVPVHRVTYRGKKDIPAALWKVLLLLKKQYCSIVHTHLFEASLIGLLAARLAGVRCRIFTRHHATMHHEYYPKAVYYDRLINLMATNIIAISENVRRVLIEKEGVPSNKITLIHHGFRLEEFEQVSLERIIHLKKTYTISPESTPVVGVISRFIHLKGLQYIIPAFEKLLKLYPNAYLVLANARGDYLESVHKLLEKIPSANYRLIPFEEDVAALYQLFDVFAHTPINAQCEAFGQTYIEALAAGVPSIFTLSGVATEFIEHHKNAWVVPFQDAECIYQSFLHLLAKDEREIQTMTTRGKYDVQQRFSLQRMIKSLEQLYDSVKPEIIK